MKTEKTVKRQKQYAIPRHFDGCFPGRLLAVKRPRIYDLVESMPLEPPVKKTREDIGERGQ